MNPEDIKVGSIWQWGASRVIVTYICADTVYFKILGIKITTCWQLVYFLTYYKPVYMVEGFEV